MQVRNIGIIAHIDAGKTTLTERILFYTKKIYHMGEVHEGTATMDSLPEEQERGISITSACTTCTWKDATINLIDTPGHVDFTIEVERSLRVLDGAIGVFCAVGGVEPQSETVWRQSEQFGVPKIAFINKMDRPGADFEATLEAMRQRLGITPLPVVIPLGAAETLSGVIDLVRMQKLHFDAQSHGSVVTAFALGAEERALAARWREQLLETLADIDTPFMQQYVQGDYPAERIDEAIRRVTLGGRGTPIFAGSAFRNIGVQPVLDAVLAYLPGPFDVLAPLMLCAKRGECFLMPEISAPFVGLVFKVHVEDDGLLAFVRMYAGTLNVDDTCILVGQKGEETVSNIYRMHADRRENIEKAVAGDIVALTGLTRATTGATIAARGQECVLEPIAVHAPVISFALEPRNEEEGLLLDQALARYCIEDPTLTVHLDEGSGHRILSGMGELHLYVVRERLQREYGLAPRAGKPLVVQHETVTHSAQAEATFEKNFGGALHHGSLALTVTLLERGQGQRISYSQAVTALAPPFSSALREALQKGIEEVLRSGPLTGGTVRDVEVCVTSVSPKEQSTVAGFHMAAGIAVREALLKGQLVRMEPVMAVDILVPEEWLGSALNLLNTRQGKVERLESRTGIKSLHALAPLSTLFGFSTELRSATQGRAGLVMQFSHFDIHP